MAEPFIGQIIMFGGNFQIRGWAFCNGQLLSIAQNTALFSLLGTTYGGNGQTTFALPDLRGRAPVHFGQGPGLSNYSLGQVGGTETQTITQNQMPAHNHQVLTNSSNGNASSAENNFIALPVLSGATPTAVNGYRTTQDGTTMNPQSISIAGGSQPLPIRPPYLALNYLIALEGIFPSRN
ncbi:MAG: tail fiber protein [Acidobacteriota bacterium]